MISWLRRIFKRERRVHKRPMVTAITVFVVFLIAASILFLNLGLLRMSSEYPQVAVQMTDTGMASSGLGVNLSYVPSTNLVWDPSFENQYREEVFSVAEASGNAVYLHGATAESFGGNEKAYRGAKLQVMSFDADGLMRQVVDARIVEFQTRQMGIWKNVDNDLGFDTNSGILRSDGKQALMIMDSGEILTDVTSSGSERLAPPEGSRFVDAVIGSSCSYAVTEDGIFFFSPNGKSWNAVEAPKLEEASIEAVTVIGKNAIACGRNSTIRVCDMNRVMVPTVLPDCDFHTAVSDGRHALLAGTSGKVYYTSNGTFFRALEQSELPCEPADEWILSYYQDGKYVLVGNLGQVAIGAFDEETDRFSFSRYLTSIPDLRTPKQLTISVDGDIWILTDNGFVYAFSEVENKWKQVFTDRDNQIESMALATSEGVLILRNGRLYTTSMYTKVTLDQDIGEVEIQNGDMCLLSVPVPSVSKQEEGIWEVFGENTSVQIVSDAPKSAGEKSLELISADADPDHAHFVSQLISRDNIQPMQEKVFYHVRLWLKQSHMDKGQVLVWLTGLSDPIGTTFTGVNGNWKEYSFTFAWPAHKNEEEPIRLNIGFYGKGEVFADSVVLEREAYSDPTVEPKLVKMLEETSAEFLRLENLGMGRLGYEISSSFPMIGNEMVCLNEDGKKVSTGVVSLESTLQLVKKCSAKPWFVIDSAFSVEELNAFLGYIGGGITDEYGKIRVDNGTAVPWGKQFERVIFEFTDNNGLFETDMQRRAYVDYMIQLIQNSKYYSDLKDKVFFVDGMPYEGGTITSAADCHSSSITISNSGSEKMEIPGRADIRDLIESAYRDYGDAAPRNPSYTQENNGEWINDLSLEVVRHRVSENEIVEDTQSLSAAEMIDFILWDLGGQTCFVTVDIPVNRLDGDADDEVFFSREDSVLANRKIRSKNNETLLRLIGVLSSVSRGDRVETSWVKPLSKTNDKDYTIDLCSYAYYRDGYIYLLVFNPTQEQQQFLLETSAKIRDVDVQRYSSEGKKIALASTGSILRLNEKRYTLQAGQFCVAVIPV